MYHGIFVHISYTQASCITCHTHFNIHKIMFIVKRNNILKHNSMTTILKHTWLSNHDSIHPSYISFSYYSNLSINTHWSNIISWVLGIPHLFPFTLVWPLYGVNAISGVVLTQSSLFLSFLEDKTIIYNFYVYLEI